MKQTQIATFLQLAADFTKKAGEAPNAKAAASYSDVAIKWYSQANAIAEQLAETNSLLLFIEAGAWLGKLADNYEAYVLFCTQNRCRIESESNFNLIRDDIRKALAA